MTAQGVMIGSADLYALREYLHQQFRINDSYTSVKELEQGKYAFTSVGASTTMEDLGFSLVTKYDQPKKGEPNYTKLLGFIHQPHLNKIVVLKGSSITTADQGFIDDVVTLLEHSIYEPILTGMH